MDPDPYSGYGSGSRKLMKKDPIRIRIHNTAVDTSLADPDPPHNMAELGFNIVINSYENTEYI